MKTGKRWIEAGISAAMWPWAVLPEAAALSLGARAGRIVARLWKERLGFAKDNIDRAVALGALTVEEPSEVLARRSFENLGRSFAELIRVFRHQGAGLMDRVTFDGLEHYERAKSKGRGVLLITGHCGNWELMCLAVARRLGPIQVVARALNHPQLNRALENIRSMTGAGVIYKDGAVRRMLTVLKNNGLVGLLMDQAVLREEACVVRFLGRPALTTRLPALIARKTGTPVVPVFIHRQPGGRHRIRFSPEIPLLDINDKEMAVRLDTENFTRSVEDYIRQYPDQWLWGHRRWKRAPEFFPPDLLGHPPKSDSGQVPA